MNKLWTATGLLLISSLAIAGDFKVLSSTAAAYRAGDVLGSNATIKLTGGEQLRLETQDKQVCLLQGPHNGRPDCPNLAQSIARLVPAQRSANGQPGTPWAVDAASPGVTCYPPGQSLVLWRPDAGQAEELAVLQPGGNGPLKLAWPRGEYEVPWPLPLPASGGVTYLLQSAQRNTLVSLQAIPAGLKTAPDRAAWMAQQGCQRQAEWLLSEGAGGGQ